MVEDELGEGVDYGFAGLGLLCCGCIEGAVIVARREVDIRASVYGEKDDDDERKVEEQEQKEGL